MKRLFAAAFAPALILAACSDTAEAPEVARSADASQSASSPAGPPPEATSDLEGAADSSQASSPAEVPLTPGVYVIEGTPCEAPANAAWRVWDGAGLSGSATEDCHADIISRQGNTYQLSNSCVDTYNGERTPETLTMTVTDQVHFTVNGQSFESCSSTQVPDELRERLER